MCCSQCRTKPVRAEGQRLCKDCHAVYMRGFRKTSRERARQKAFLQGFQSLKDDLRAAFLRIGKAELNGYLAAEIVTNSQPKVSRETST